MAVSSAAFPEPMCLVLQDSTHGCVIKLFKETVEKKEVTLKQEYLDLGEELSSYSLLDSILWSRKHRGWLFFLKKE